MFQIDFPGKVKPKLHDLVGLSLMLLRGIADDRVPKFVQLSLQLGIIHSVHDRSAQFFTHLERRSRRRVYAPKAGDICPGNTEFLQSGNLRDIRIAPITSHRDRTDSIRDDE